MKFLKILFIALLCAYLGPDVSGQMPNASANFNVPDIEITTTPEFPGICNPLLGVQITCNQDYLSYSWKRKNGTDLPLSGKTVTIKKIGIWVLTVEAQIGGRICMRSHEFNVRDLKNNNEILAKGCGIL